MKPFTLPDLNNRSHEEIRHFIMELAKQAGYTHSQRDEDEIVTIDEAIAELAEFVEIGKELDRELKGL